MKHIFCGSSDCMRCREFVARVLTPPSTTKPDGPAVTRERLEKHAKRFGWAGVAEVAAAYGIELEAPTTPAPKKVSKPSRKKRVAVLIKDGYSVEKIAAIEEISPSYARRLVAELQKQ